MIKDNHLVLISLDKIDKEAELMLLKMDHYQLIEEALYIRHTIFSKSELFRFLPNGVFSVVGRYIWKIMEERNYPLELKYYFLRFLNLLGFYQMKELNTPLAILS